MILQKNLFSKFEGLKNEIAINTALPENDKDLLELSAVDEDPARFQQVKNEHQSSKQGTRTGSSNGGG